MPTQYLTHLQILQEHTGATIQNELANQVAQSDNPIFQMRTLLFLFFALTAASLALAQPIQSTSQTPQKDNFSDTWVAVDALGRKLPDMEKTGPPRKDRFVAMFYFLTGGSYGPDFKGPYDNSFILKEYPQAINEIHHPAWGPDGAAHYWGKPLFGYYRSDDEWVIRKHAAMLANAGVDVLIFDCSNAVTYTSVYHKLFDVFTQIRREGGKTPQVAFLCPFSNFQGIGTRTSRFLYDDFYSKGLYSDLWFRWKGKPLLVADPGYVEKALQDFFTLRSPVALYNVGPSAPNQWAWLEVYPQHVFPGPDSKAEEMAVGVAQNYNTLVNNTAPMSWPGSMGRSYHHGATDASSGAVNHGYNFSEQWDEALKDDPELVWVTGWNEWTAGKYPSGCAGTRPRWCLSTSSTRSAAAISSRWKAATATTIIISWSIMSGNTRSPSAAAGRGRPDRHRRALRCLERGAAGIPRRGRRSGASPSSGEGIAGIYQNDTGRNDIVSAKVSYDAANVYFYVQTRDPITPCTDPNWMMLYLNSDANYQTGWLGYDFVINRSHVTATTTTIEKNLGGKYAWGNPVQIPYVVKGNQMELSVPRRLLGIDHLPASIDFKWADKYSADRRCHRLLPEWRRRAGRPF